MHPETLAYVSVLLDPYMFHCMVGDFMSCPASLPLFRQCQQLWVRGFQHRFAAPCLTAAHIASMRPLVQLPACVAVWGLKQFPGELHVPTLCTCTAHVGMHVSPTEADARRPEEHRPVRTRLRQPTQSANGNPHVHVHFVPSALKLHGISGMQVQKGIRTADTTTCKNATS